MRTTYDQFGRLKAREEVKPSGAIPLERYEYDMNTWAGSTTR
ncbi:hypothetical protein ABU162_29850 [Paenibacillus thiaminolyticus]